MHSEQCYAFMFFLYQFWCLYLHEISYALKYTLETNEKNNFDTKESEVGAFFFEQPACSVSLLTHSVNICAIDYRLKANALNDIHCPIPIWSHRYCFEQNLRLSRSSFPFLISGVRTAIIYKCHVSITNRIPIFLLFHYFAVKMFNVSWCDSVPLSQFDIRKCGTFSTWTWSTRCGISPAVFGDIAVHWFTNNFTRDSIGTILGTRLGTLMAGFTNFTR